MPGEHLYWLNWIHFALVKRFMKHLKILKGSSYYNEDELVQDQQASE